MFLRPNYSQVFGTKFANTYKLLEACRAQKQQHSKSWPGYNVDLMQTRLRTEDIQAFTKTCAEVEKAVSESILRKLQVSGAIGLITVTGSVFLGLPLLPADTCVPMLFGGLSLLALSRVAEQLPAFQSREKKLFDELRMLTEKIPLTHPAVKLALHRPPKDPIREFGEHLANRGFATALEIQMLNRAELGREAYFVSRKVTTR